MDPAASSGLRSTRTTARHADVWDAAVSDGGTSNVSEPESLRKTHLDWKARMRAAFSPTMFTLNHGSRQAAIHVSLWEFSGFLRD
jgi:hypothetical protein